MLTSEEKLSRQRERCRAWRLANADKVRAYNKKWQRDNVGYGKAYYQKRKAEKPNFRRDRYRTKERAQVSKRNKERLRSDLDFAITRRLRTRLCHALRAANANKAYSTLDLVGCGLDDLKRHISDQFLPGMSWSNRDQWHIDHIRPCSSFDLTDPIQQRQCFHYTNLRPLWATDNMQKHANWPEVNNASAFTNKDQGAR